jgi:hypothetical protein
MAVDSQLSMAGGHGAGHPSLEMLAAYADRNLTAADAAIVERHASVCGACRETLSDVSAFVASGQADKEPGTRPVSEPRRTTKPLIVLLAAAAVLTLAVRTIMPERLPRWLGGTTPESRLAALMAAASRSPTRFTSGRLTGFPYAPSTQLTRGGAERAAPPEIRIAAAEVEQRIGASETAADLAALGVAHLASGDREGAVASLAKAATMTPENAQIQNDLAAAYLARARDQDGDYGSALAAAERALAAADPPVEALFNRAVALEQMGLREPAARAWQDYLARDSSSPWATEARARAGALAPSTSAPPIRP